MMADGSTVDLTLTLRSVQQLLLSPEAVPFATGRIRPDAETFLVDQLRKGPRGHRMRLVVIIPATELRRARDIGSTIHEHFALRHDQVNQQITDTWRVGRRSLLLGIVLLTLVLACVDAAGRFIGEGPLSRSVQEGLTILGWVALWRPAELLLHEWRPLREQARLFADLQHLEVYVTSSVNETPIRTMMASAALPGPSATQYHPNETTFPSSRARAGAPFG
jgi:hypothetical protein